MHESADTFGTHSQEPSASTRGRAVTGDAVTATAVASHFGELLHRNSPHAALAFLNARTRFRFTGIYRKDDETLRNVEIFDRENPALRGTGECVLLRETYCGIICRSVAPFATSDTRRDDRLTHHPARDTVQSYCGVPIRTPGGAVWGTLCHFDQRPRLAPAGESAVLAACGRQLAHWLP